MGKLKINIAALTFLAVLGAFVIKALIAFGLAYGFRWVTGLDLSDAVVNFGGFIMALCLNFGSSKDDE